MLGIKKVSCMEALFKYDITVITDKKCELQSM